MWVVFALLSGLAVASRDTLSKRLLQSEINLYVLGGWQFLIAGVILFSILPFTTIPELQPGFYLAVSGTVTLNVIATILLLKALKEGDLSIAIPMLSFTPIFLILTSFLMLGELPTILGGVGILFIVLGSYVLHWEVFGDSIRNVFGRIRTSHASLLVLLVALIYSITANFDKIAVVTSAPIFSAAVVSTLLGATLLLLSFIMPRKYRIEAPPMNPFFLLMLVATGVLLAIAIYAQNVAFTMEIVPYVNAVKRAGLLFAVLFGALLFKEQHIRWRLIGAMLMLFGIALIAL